MSLPSDVTINNLKDFYAMILPYLNVGNGGTSDTPLGQVAFFDDVVAPAGWLIADGTVYNIADYLDLANQYERVHGSKNFYGGNGTTTFAVPDWDAIPAEVFGNSNIICVKAVPSSEMNVYSLTERKVGTDTDGKPVYQKSYVLTTAVNTSKDSWVTVVTDSGLSTVSKLKNYECSCGDGNPRVDTPYAVRINGNNVQAYQCDEGTCSIKEITIKYTKTTD